MLTRNDDLQKFFILTFYSHHQLTLTNLRSSTPGNTVSEPPNSTGPLWTQDYSST